MAWTDERMDDLTSRMDAGFARTDNDIRELRTEIRGTRDELKTDIRDTRTELKADIRDTRTELKADIDGLRTLTMRFGIAMIVGMLGMIATLIGVVASGAVGG